MSFLKEDDVIYLVVPTPWSIPYIKWACKTYLVIYVEIPPVESILLD